MKRPAARHSPETLSATQRLGSALRSARIRRRITQQQLGDRAGLSKQTIGRLEAGDPGIALGNFLEILQVLERSWASDLVDMIEDDRRGRALESQRLPSRVVNDDF